MTIEEELTSALELRSQAVETLNVTIDVWKRFEASQKSLRDSYIKEGMGVDKAAEDFSAQMAGYSDQFIAALETLDHWSSVVAPLLAGSGAKEAEATDRPAHRRTGKPDNVKGQGYIPCPDCGQTGTNGYEPCNLCVGEGWILDPVYHGDARRP